MEQARLVLAIALSFLVLLAWNYFFLGQDAVNPPPATTQQPTAEREPAKPEETPLPDAAPVAAVEQPIAAPTDQPARLIIVETPIYRVTISEKGGTFTSFVLKNYDETVAENSPHKELLADDLKVGTVQTTLAGSGMPDMSSALFTADTSQSDIVVSDQPETLVLTHTTSGGVVMQKTFTFNPDTYLIDLMVDIQNHTSNPIDGDLTLTLANHTSTNKKQFGFEGPSALINNKLEQIDTGDIEEKNIYGGNIGWAAIESRYFLSSIVPASSEEARLLLDMKDETLLLSHFVLPAISVSPKSERTFAFSLFFGPKSLKILSSLNNGLDKAIHFGMFDILAKPCLWLMNWIYGIIPNYGIAIIILTILIKIVLWPLGNKSYKSMNEMKRIQPLMADLRERYKDDKRKMNEELMKLYKVYKINPMGGCLPMLFQIPVFFALYRMLYEAIELRHAPFFGWITDLSAPDRLFQFGFSIPFMEPPYGIPVLTIVMGATMLLQQKMSPPPGDPAQAKMMMFMPIIFTVIFINFSAGLVLYWLVNNVLSIAQQYYIQKKYA